MNTVNSIISSNPKLSTFFQLIPLILGAFFLLLLFYIFAPSTSLIRESEFGWVLGVIFLIADLVFISTLKYLDIKTSTLTYGPEQNFILTKKAPWLSKKNIPLNKVRYVTIEQKGWQRRFGVVNTEIYSLANDSASIIVYSVPEKQAEELINFVERLKTKEGA